MFLLIYEADTYCLLNDCVINIIICKAMVIKP